MAYGCIVVTDNPVAEKLTNGIVKKINSFSEINDIIKYYKIIQKKDKKNSKKDMNGLKNMVHISIYQIILFKK